MGLDPTYSGYYRGSNDNKELMILRDAKKLEAIASDRIDKLGALDNDGWHCNCSGSEEREDGAMDLEGYAMLEFA